MPKVYFYDVGLASWLLGIITPEHIRSHPLRGNLFESFIIAELAKAKLNRGERPDLFFWRDSNGNEVDIIAEQGGMLRPIEIKSGKTLTDESTKSLRKYQALAKDSSMEPTLIYGGDTTYSHQGINCVGWRECVTNFTLPL